jgi:hypothetical protein
MCCSIQTCRAKNETEHELISKLRKKMTTNEEMKILSMWLSIQTCRTRQMKSNTNLFDRICKILEKMTVNVEIN